jgi:BirA family biotin operon repressor/biotin-[acetyl-CoA-carboxylase] ligase
MNTLFIGQKLIEFPSVASTNTYAAELLQRGDIEEGTVIFAHNQTNGRGQRGNKWEAEPDKNLILSVILKPTFISVSFQFELNKAVSLAVCDLINAFLAKDKKPLLKIKWPNDIYMGNKKIGGILIENIVKGYQLAYSVIGIGLNINQEVFPDFLLNPVSLTQITHIKYNLIELREQLCIHLENRYLQLKSNLSNISENYLKMLFRFNERALYFYQGGKINARIIGVTNYGKLILETLDGNIMNCDFKEINFEV